MDECKEIPYFKLPTQSKCSLYNKYKVRKIYIKGVFFSNQSKTSYIFPFPTITCDRNTKRGGSDSKV